MACDPQTLLADAAPLVSLTEQQREIILISLMCQLLATLAPPDPPDPTPPNSVDLLIRFEDGPDEAAVTPTILNNATLKTAPAANGNWTVPSIAPRIDTAQEIPVDGLEVSGVGSPDTGTRSLKSNVAQDQVIAQYNITNAVAQASCGFAFRTNMTGATANTYKVAALNGSGPDLVAMLITDGAAPVISLTNISDDSSLDSVPVAQNTWYWITMFYDTTGPLTCRLRVYTLPGLVQVGPEVTIDMATAGSFNSLEIGRIDDSGLFGTEDVFIDDFALSMLGGTGATFPLLPA